jgi:hypothetical protein
LLTEIVFDEPWPSVPVSKLCPSSAVTVWDALSSLVTVTPAPGLTVSGLGVNLKSLIVTPVELPLGAELDEELLGFAVAPPLSPPPPPQPAISIAVAAMARSGLTGSRKFMRTTVRPPVGRSIGSAERVIARGDQPCGPREDTAQIDDVAEVLRSVGPTVVGTRAAPGTAQMTRSRSASTRR